MAYMIGEVTKELLETVHEFCEKRCATCAESATAAEKYRLDCFGRRWNCNFIC